MINQNLCTSLGGGVLVIATDARFPPHLGGPLGDEDPLPTSEGAGKGRDRREDRLACSATEGRILALRNRNRSLPGAGRHPRMGGAAAGGGQLLPGRIDPRVTSTPAPPRARTNRASAPFLSPIGFGAPRVGSRPPFSSGLASPRPRRQGTHRSSNERRRGPRSQ